jgi:hypothetical protein
MRLKTNHGTYVVAGHNGELLHLPDPIAQDFKSVWSEAPPPVPAPWLVEAPITEGPLASSTLVVLGDDVVGIRRNRMYLCADPTHSEMRFDREQPGEWECFAIETTDGEVVRHARAEPIAHTPSLSRPVLIETLAGYQIMTPAGDADLVSVTWPELSKTPMSRYTLPDGSWIVDVDGTSEPDHPYLVYWFYPFDDTIHVWQLDRTGQRLFGYNLSEHQARAFLLGRRALGPAFTIRLYMLSQRLGEWGTVALLSGDLLAAAEAGSTEALYTVVRYPHDYPPEKVRPLSERAFHLLRAANRAEADETEAHLTRCTVHALSQALSQLDPALGGFSSEQLQSELDLRQVFADPKHLPDSATALPFSLHCHTEASLVSLLGGAASIQTLGILIRPHQGALEFHYVNSGGGIRLRVLDSIRYAYYVLSTNREAVWSQLAAREPEGKSWMVRFEVGDLPTTAMRSAAFERLSGDTNFALIPDSYFFAFKGFRSNWFNGDILPWSKKANRVLWRGSTTGAYDLTRDTVSQAPRVRLCELGRTMGPVADFGITDVVHARSKADAEDIKLFLQDQDVWRERMSQTDMGANKFLLEIDGNANSWGFFAKLLMGCCVLKVHSPFEQWFYDRLQPGIHYVPVAHDLSDLPDKVQWCLRNERACHKIADAGRRLAESMTFEAEMASAANAFVSVAWLADEVTVS